jgi:hypothetical protein
MKDVIENNMVALARRRSANKRSQMLKMIMPHLSHENGEALSNAISTKNAAKFKAVWERIKKEIAGKLEHFKSHSSGFDMDEFYENVMSSLSSETQVLTGSGELKEALRALLVEGVITMSDTRKLRITQLDAKSSSNSSEYVYYNVRTALVDMEGNVVKSLTGTGKLAPILLDQIILARHFVALDK